MNKEDNSITKSKFFEFKPSSLLKRQSSYEQGEKDLLRKERIERSNKSKLGSLKSTISETTAANSGKSLCEVETGKHPLRNSECNIIFENEDEANSNSFDSQPIFNFERMNEIAKIFYKNSFNAYYNFKTNSHKIKPFYKPIELKTQTSNLTSQLDKRLLILGLDQTIVHRDSNPENCQYTFKLNLEDKIKVGIHIRPYLKEFLKNVSEHYELVLFTSSQQTYAEHILDIIDPERKIFLQTLYRESCQQVVINDQPYYIKNAGIFKNISMNDILIVDYSVMSYAFNFSNGIPIAPFLGDDDDELQHLESYLMYLKDYDDIQFVNKLSYKLEEYINSYFTEDFLFNSRTRGFYCSSSVDDLDCTYLDFSMDEDDDNVHEIGPGASNFINPSKNEASFLTFRCEDSYN